jgi:hypothetical protein
MDKQTDRQTDEQTEKLIQCGLGNLIGFSRSKSMKHCSHGSSNCVKNANTSNHTLISWTMLMGFFILENQLASQNVFLISSELSITAYLFLVLYRSTIFTVTIVSQISFLYYIDLHLYSHYPFSKILRPFCASRSWWIIIVFLQCNSLTITIVSQKYWELLQPYSHDCFAKILRTFCASRN